MKIKRIVLGVLACALVSAVAFAQGFVNIKELLTGYEEVPSVSTGASGEFTAKIRKDSTIDWQLSYSDLEGAVQQSHIHLGQTGVNGGITVFLCTNLGQYRPATLSLQGLSRCRVASFQCRLLALALTFLL